LAVRVQPYLYFCGRCDEAAAFYASAVGAEVVVRMRFSDAPPGGGAMTLAPGWEEKVMHMEMRIGTATVMASDGMGPGAARFEGFSLVLVAEDAADAAARFGALGVGGAVRMPLGPTFFSPAFGMVADRFGVLWTVFAG
jgi:PhnB protein